MTTEAKRQLATLLRTADKKGRLLEDATVAALPDYGFVGIRRQQSGAQYGFDILAYRKSEQDSVKKSGNLNAKTWLPP